MASNNFADIIKRGDATSPWVLTEFSGPQGERKFTLRDLDHQADRIAAGLREVGIGPGCVVAIAAYNSAAYLAVFLGTLRAGAVLAPLNNKLSEEVAGYIVADSNAQWLFYDNSCPASLRALLPGIPLDSPEFDTFGQGREITTVQPERDALALLLYTSGSTGMPKGVMHSHGGLLDMLVGSGVLANPLYRKRSIVAAPLYHMNGLLYSLMFLAGGGSVVLLPRFEVATYVEGIARFNVTAVTGVPSMIAMISQAFPDHPGLPSVLRVSLGSAPLSDGVLRQAAALFPNAVLGNVYGATEIGVPFGPHPDGIATPAASVGYAASYAQLRLVDGDGPDAGVLEVRAAGMMSGYLNLPELTRTRLRNGWYRTGDKFTRDRQGFYYFVGREDDMFVCGGENIYPIEVERIIDALPGVRQCSVVPVADQRRGQIPVAFVVADAGIEAAQVKEFVLANGPAYLHPRHVFLVETLPVSAINKIDRKQLQQEAAERVANLEQQ